MFAASRRAGSFGPGAESIAAATWRRGSAAMASVAAPLLDFLSALPRIALHRYYADRSTCQALLRALPPLARLCARALCSRHAVISALPRR